MLPSEGRVKRGSHAMINSLVNHRHHSALAVDSVLHIMSHCVDRCTQTERHTHVEHIVAIVGCGQIETVVNMLNLVHRGVLDRTWTTVGWMFSSLRDGKPGRTRTQTLCILVPFLFLFRLRFAVFVAPSPSFGQKLANACQQLLWRIY